MADFSESLGYALVGCGGFGLFCLEKYLPCKGLRPVAVVDIDPDRAGAVARKFSLQVLSFEEALAREDISVLHLATPPSTHRSLAVRALEAGKNVLSEKPLALTLEDGRAMCEAASASGRVLSVNLIMRYNPLCVAVRKIIEEGLLGEPLHGFFENYAKDEQLGPEHWFWKPEISGGIFIEHGVHFFDLYSWWLGGGRVVAAQQVLRPGAGLKLVEQVNCTVMYGSVPVNFYHGFTQAERMDRQEMRLLFERGSVSLDEWVPTRIRIDCIADQGTIARICDLAPGRRPEVLENYNGRDRYCTARHKELEIDGRYHITLETGMNKEQLYGRVIRSLMEDHLWAINDPGHTRRVSDREGLSSLQLAVDATRLASGEA